MQTEKLTQSEKSSHLIKVSPKGKPAFFIPVIDVRDGEDQRNAAKSLLKASNMNRGSQYIKPTYTLFGENYNTNYSKTQEQA